MSTYQRGRPGQPDDYDVAEMLLALCLGLGILVIGCGLLGLLLGT